jgi:hypothetical protein
VCVCETLGSISGDVYESWFTTAIIHANVTNWYYYGFSKSGARGEK